MKHRHRRSITGSLCGFVILAASLLLPRAQASTIGYWHLQDGAPGSNVTTINSEVNNSQMQATVSAHGATPPTFNSANPGFGSPDAGSMRLELDNSLVFKTPYSALAEPASFTIEFFLNTTTAETVAYSAIVAKPRTADNKLSWGFGLAPGGRVLWTGNTTLYDNIAESAGPSLGDGKWHHVAMTYDSTTLRMYVDYQLVYANGAGGALIYDGVSGLAFGRISPAGPFAGLVDEIRFSNVALSPSEFLTVPEPGAAALLCLGTLVIAGVRRWKQHD